MSSKLDRRRTRTVIVRHAQSTFNMQQRFQGRSDEPVLTDIGVAAAVQTGRHLVTERVDGVVSSPLRRASQTAEIIVAVLRESGQDQLFLNTSDDLMEIHLPEWEGAGLDKIRRQCPENYRAWSDEPQEFQMPVHGRPTFPVRELFAQAEKFWGEFLERQAGQSVVLVTHGGTARALICTALGVKPERFQLLQQSNCGISIMEFPAGSNRAQVEALNLTAHLEERMPKLKLGRRGMRIVVIAADAPRPHGAHVSGILNNLRIDFVLGAEDVQSKETASQILQAHPRAQPGIFPDSALFDNQHPETLPLAGLSASSQHALSTGVLVTRNSELDALLSAVLGIEQRGAPPWKHAANVVLHYASAGKRPVIQALNIPIWKQTPDLVMVEACQ